MKRILMLCLIAFCGICFSGCGKQTAAAFSFSAGTPTPVVREFSMAVVGDIMVHDYQYNEAYDPASDTYNFLHNFQAIKSYFEGYDLLVGNLELTFGGPDRPYSSYPCFNTPDNFMDALLDAGFDVLTTANNHCMDTGKDGLLRTLNLLDAAGIRHTGTFRSQEEKDSLCLVEAGGLTVAFVSFTYGTNGIPVPDDYLVNLLDEETVTTQISRARAAADVVVVLPHMGNEYESYVRPVFQDWADLMFEAGADIILASHPHVLQPMEYRKLDNGDGTYRDGFIIYSLGNFISSQTTPPRNASIILQLTVEQVGNDPAQVKSVSFVPIWTQFRNAADQNHFMVRAVYDMLTLPEEERYQVVRPKDYQRLLEIHEETACFLLGEEIPLSEIQPSYDFPKTERYTDYIS